MRDSSKSGFQEAIEAARQSDVVVMVMGGSSADFSYLSDIEPGVKDVFAEKYQGRYFFTPKKMGAQTEEANVNAGIAAAKQIVSFFKDGNQTFRVNK